MRGEPITERFKASVKAHILKNAPHLLILLLFSLLVVLGSRNALIQVAADAGKGVSPSATFLVQSLGGPIWQVKSYPGILLTQLFSLPLYSVWVIFFVLFQLASGFFMYAFVHRYLGIVLGDTKRSARILFSLFGGLIYIYFPYNILGDNFPELFFMRALIPLYLLLFMEFIERKNVFLFMSSSVLLAIMIFNEPRALLFAPILAFFFIVAPRISSSFGLKSRVLIFIAFALNVGLSFLLSDFSLFPRLTTTSVPTNVSVPFVRDAFRYYLSGMANTFRGLSFEGTYQVYNALAAGLPSVASALLSTAQLLIPLLTFSILSLIGIWRLKKTKTAAYVIIPIFFTLILMLFFVKIGDDPLFEKMLFAVPSGELSANIKTLALLFRTPRFTNITLSLVYGVLSPLALAISFKVLMVQNKNKTAISRGVKKIASKKLLFFTILAIYSFSIISTTSLFLAKGDSFSDLTSEQVQAYERVRVMFEQDVGYRRFVSVPYAYTPWTFPQPPAGISNSILRYYYAYTLSPEIASSLLNRNQTRELANILSIGSIKYVIIDGYLGDQSRILSLLDQSSAFSYTTTIGKLYVYMVNDFRTATLANPLFVLGGMETYRKMLLVLDGISNNSSFAPVFLDGPVGSNVIDISAPIISSPNKSILDLMAPLLIDNNRSVIIAPSQYTTEYNPSSFWSPGFVSDTHHGVWIWAWPQAQGYEWEYSYRPDYGFAFTSGSDELFIKFVVPETGCYQIFTRVLMHPENASLKIEIGDVGVTVNTGGSFSSTEFLWVRLGEFELQRGEHTLKVVNQEGSNAINLILLAPSDEVQRVTEVTEAFFDRVGDIKLVASNIDDVKVFHDTIGTAEVSLNAIKEGRYSMLIKMVDELNNTGADVKLAVGNKTYETRILSVKPLLVYAEEVFLEQGQQTLKIFPIQANLAMNPSFEEWSASESNPEFWNIPTKEFIGTLDKSTKLSGNFSYKLVTNSTKNGAWSWVSSEEIPVKPDEVYVIETHMKWENVLQSHITIQYQTDPNSSWRILTPLPSGRDGSSNWTEFRTEIKIPEGATSIRIILNAGWVNDSSKGEAVTWFDDIKIYKKSPSDISILVYGPQGSLADELMSQGTPQESKANLNYVHINSLDWNYREYDVSFTTNSSVMLVIPELYTGTMRVSIDNSVGSVKYSTFPIYYVFTGIWFEVQEVSQPQTFNMTLYREEGGSFIKSGETAMLTMGVIVVAAMITDLFIFRRREWIGSWNKKLLKKLQKITLRRALRRL